jgi:hypothetical protein
MTEMDKITNEFAKLIAEELYNIMRKYPLTQGEREALSCAITNFFKATKTEIIKPKDS